MKLIDKQLLDDVSRQAQKSGRLRGQGGQVSVSRRCEGTSRAA